MNEPYQHEIKNEYIMQDLLAQGFYAVATDKPGVWVMEAPPELSKTKARKIVSTCINLFVAAKQLSRSRLNYQRLIEELNQLNMTR